MRSPDRRTRTGLACSFLLAILLLGGPPAAGSTSTDDSTHRGTDRSTELIIDVTVDDPADARRHGPPEAARSSARAFPMPIVGGTPLLMSFAMPVSVASWGRHGLGAPPPATVFSSRWPADWRRRLAGMRRAAVVGSESVAHGQKALARDEAAAVASSVASLREIALSALSALLQLPDPHILPAVPAVPALSGPSGEGPLRGRLTAFMWLTAPADLGAIMARRLSWVEHAVDHALAMIPAPLLRQYPARWASAPLPADTERRSRGWVVGCWFSLIVWGAALSACAVGLRRHVRRLSRSARALQRRLGAIRTAMRAMASSRCRVAAAAAAAAAADASLSDPARVGERLGMVATLCHEIRTPMHAVIGILELLMHKTAIRGETRYYISTAHECAKSLITLVGDVLDMAKLEAGRLEIRPEAVQLPTLMRQLVHAFRPLAVSQHLRIRLRLGPLRCRRHRVDPQRLRQIVGNLLSNAIKYSHHGEIVVKLESTGDGIHGESIRIVVQDQGPGIDAQQMPRLFEPFFRGNGDGGTSGTGLGLSISRQLARQMGGELEIVSTAGAGTIAIVTLVLPSAAGAGRAGRAEARQAIPRLFTLPQPLRRGYCALVVDDHPAGRMLLARQLSHLSVEAVCAGDGAEALALCAARTGGFDVVITDCNMPGMDGFDLTRRLREQERTLARERVPVLGYSADARQQNLERALVAGMDDCLFKPIDLDSLARVLQRWLREMPACAGRQSMPPGPAPAPCVPRQPPAAASVPADVPADVSETASEPASEVDPNVDPNVVSPQSAAGPAQQADGKSPARGVPKPAIPTEAAIREALLAGNASDLAAMRAAFGAMDWSAMRAIAHRLKGATRLASAHAAASCCEAIEAACRRHDAGAAAMAIASLAQRLEELAKGKMRF